LIHKCFVCKQLGRKISLLECGIAPNSFSVKELGNLT
jgi:hypothetical protein